MIKKLLKEKQLIFMAFILVMWAGVIFLKQGGLSLIVHYLWPVIVLGAFVLLMKEAWLKNKVGILHILGLITFAVYLLTFLFDLTPSDGSLELMNISGGILLVLVLSQEKFEEKAIKFLFWGMVLIVAAANVWGIILYSVGHPFNRLAGPLFKQYEAFSGYPNLLANLNLVVLIPAFYLFIANNKNKFIGALLFILNVLIISGLTLTYSRAAWISAGIVIAITAVILLIKFRKKRALSLKYITAALFIGLVSLLLTASINAVRNSQDQAISISQKITFSAEDEGSSIIERISSFQRGLKMAFSHPFTGVGAGSFNYISQSYEQNFETLSSYPYSLPIKIIAENGIVFFVLVFIWIISITISTFKQKSNYIFIGGLTLIILVLHHIVDNNFDFFSASLPFFLFLGIIWPKDNKRTKSLSIKNKWILITILIVMISGCVFAAHEAWYGKYYITGRDAAGAMNYEKGYEEYFKSLNLFYPRDTLLAASNSAWEMFVYSNDQKWLDNAYKAALQYYQKDNPLDRRGPLQLAKVSLLKRNFRSCVDWSETARTIGGENYFETDYYELKCFYDSGNKERAIEFSKSLKPKLEKYLELLKINAHMTVLTDNPKYAIMILEMLKKDNSPKFEELYQQMYTTAQNELQKFHQKYGIKA